MKAACFGSRVALTAILLTMIASSGTDSVALALQDVQSGWLSALRWRNVGPMRGGRVNAVAGIPGNPNVYYFGAAAGGVWRSTDGGVSWTPVFDDQRVGAIGAIAIAPSDPNVIYVGTGDPRVRITVSHGDGVYKSLDAGDTWENVGLRDSRHIGRVIVHPRNPDVVLVAALGHVFGENEERGVFKTTDGGESWQRVLHVDTKTGGIDVAFDPSNPNVVFASLWQVLRTPYSLVSGGPGSGLYRSADGGSTWTRLAGNGLPEGILGKIGVAVSGADSNRVYAVIEAKEGGLYRSDDGGESWRRQSPDYRLTNRAWYHTDVIPDPRNPDLLYVMNGPFLKSIDGGKGFQVVDQYHVDNMALWIDPQNPQRMINGNDGGANISFNGGVTWTRSDQNQPTGQFYHVSTDDRFPYYLYGGQQDFDSVAIASRRDGYGVPVWDWYEVGGCEMGFVYPHPRDPNIVYAGCTDGSITRYDYRTQRHQSIQPWPEMNIGHGAASAKYRFQWTAAMNVSPHDPDVLYYAANVVFKTSDGGMSWTIISPDLTRDDESKQAPSGGPITLDNVGGEFYCTIFALAESPRRAGLLWAGSDDGLVHATFDGGGNWVNVTPKDLPEWTRINAIEPSPHDASTAYLAGDRHKLNDYTPYVYKTNDSGKTWERITRGLPTGNDFVRVVREDPVRRGLLYLGTETGAYVSFDDGESWQPLRLNLPATPVFDLKVKGDDLVAATFGRAFWILDDVTPLRQLTPAIVEADAHLFEPAAAHRVRDMYHRDRYPAGENLLPGAFIDYSLKSEPTTEVTLSIHASSGETLATFSSSAATATQRLAAEPGLNRIRWDMRHPGPRSVPGQPFWRRPPDGPPVGPLAMPGEYEVKLSVGGRSQTARLELKPDPRITTPPAELEAQFRLHSKLRDDLSLVADAILRIRDLRGQLKSLERRVATEAAADEVTSSIRKVLDELAAIENEMTEPRVADGIGSLSYPQRLDNKLAVVMGVVANSDRAPTKQTYENYEEIWARIETQLSRLNEIISRDVPAINRVVSEGAFPMISAGAPLGAM